MAWPKSEKTIRVPKGNLYATECPARDILDHVTSRWGSLVLVLLLRQTYRFSELAYLIGGVSEKMLAQTLRVLEEDGFVRRTVYTSKPPRVEYSLTPLGSGMGERMKVLTTFVERSVGKVMANRALAERRHEARAA